MQITSDNYDIKADITRYFTVGEHRNLRILINKMVIISNMFTFEIAQKLMFFRHKQFEEHISFLKTVFTFLDQMPELGCFDSTYWCSAALATVIVPTNIKPKTVATIVFVNLFILKSTLSCLQLITTFLIIQFAFIKSRVIFR